MAGRTAAQDRNDAGVSWCSKCRAYSVRYGVCASCAPTLAGVEPVVGDRDPARELHGAPLSPCAHAGPRAQRVRDLYRKLLNAAEDALDTVTAGRATPRELQSHAYVATTLMRAAAELEGDDAEGANPDQLEAEIARLQRELKKR